MSRMPRRTFFLILGALLPGALKSAADAATKKPSPTPKKKKPKPTPTRKKPSPTPTPSKSSSPKTTPTPQSTQSKVTDGVVIAKSSDLLLRQTKIYFIKDSFGVSSGYSLTRTSRGVVAFDVRCTHNGVPSSLSGRELKCPAHGSIFDPETGQAIRGPAVEPLKSYRTIESDGEIRIVIS